MNYKPFTLQQDHWYVIVESRQFGPWPDRGSASAGYETEVRRAAKAAMKKSYKLGIDGSTDIKEEK